jgi:hypothetical protein
MSDQLYTHAFYVGGQFLLSDDGDIELPVSSALGHRFQMTEDGVVDMYGGVDDDAVRVKDWEDGVAAAEDAGETPPPDFRIPSPE